MEFLDRIEERDRLERVLSLPEGCLACLYGRRRIGKSRLLEEVLADRDQVVAHVADRSDAALQRARLAKDMSANLPGFDRVSYPDWGTLFDRWCKETSAGSVLVIDELPYLVEQSPELPSILQRVADGLRKTGQKLFLCGSSQHMMQGLLLKPDEPLYGRAREMFGLGPIGFGWTKRAFPKLSVWERFEHYALWGGVPRYWEVCQGERDLWETVRLQIFSPHGLFHDEPDFLLHDDLSDAVQAMSILSLIGQGMSRLTEIAARLQVPVTSLTRPLKRLVDLGLVVKDMPFGALEKGNKKSMYCISDPFLRFWYTFALPNYSDPYYLSTAAERKSILAPFSVYLGVSWEQMVREGLRKQALPDVPGRWRKVSRWWGTGLDRSPMEVDVVAESVDGETLLVGEAKLSLTAAEARRTMNILQAKAAKLPFAGNYRKVITRLFVAKGGSFDCISLDWLDVMG